MLTKLTIDSFKAFGKATEVPLQPFTMFIGPNGSGKSTTLQAIDLLGSLVNSDLHGYLGRHESEYRDLPHNRISGKKLSVTADLRIDDVAVKWKVTLGARRNPGIVDESVVKDHRAPPLLERTGRRMTRRSDDGSVQESLNQTLTSSWLSAIDPDQDASRFPTLARLARWARGIRGYFFLDPRLLRAPSRGQASDIGQYGGDLAAFLVRLKPGVLKAIEDRVRRHYPRLVKLHPRRRAYGWARLEVSERWKGKEVSYNARQVSDGLLRLIAIAAMHELPEPPSVLLIEEIENGLHPGLLQSLVTMLQELVDERRGSTQVIVTTHSPITVNAVESHESVVIVDRDDGEAPRFTPLTDAKGYSTLIGHFDPGELWYNLGEKKLVP